MAAPFCGLFVHLLVVRGLKMNKNVGVVASFEGKWATVKDRVAFVQNHVARLHSHIVGATIVRVHLYGPGLVNILRNLKNSRCDERQAVNMRGEHGSILVDSNPVQRRMNQRLPVHSSKTFCIVFTVCW